MSDIAEVEEKPLKKFEIFTEAEKTLFAVSER